MGRFFALAELTTFNLNLNNVFYPADGYTKRDVINFYAAVADLLVPHLQARPLSLKWEEVVPGLKPAQFHIANVLRRFDRVGDLFGGALNKPQELGPAIEKLSAVMA